MNKNYCVDCKKEIGKGYKRCHSCAAKYFQSTPEFKNKLISRSTGKNNPNYKHDKTNNNKCSYCGTKIRFRSKVCRKCYYEYRNYTNKTRSKMSLSHGGTGKPYELFEYGNEFDNSLKEQVRMRDKYTCRECGCSQVENSRQLDCHHIDYDKKNNNINNLISLCRSCHMKTNYNIKYWKEYLKEKMYGIFQRG